jgi:hypothetical protein
MKTLRPLVLAATVLAAGPALAADRPPAASAADRPPAASAADRPTVVELFTSQGCSSCPPADALLGELTRRADVLPLAFHVDYWNRLGWKDPYSSADSTARQRAYARLLDLRTIYTPQMVVDGRIDVVGSERAAVLKAIEAARASSIYTPQMVVDGRIDVVGSERAAVLKAIEAARASQRTVPIELARDGDGLRVRVGAGEGEPGRATVLLVGFDRQHVTKIGAGENGGRTLAEWHLVRGVTPLGAWTGTAHEVTVPADRLSGYERVAVLLQGDDGRMLGAAALDAQLAAKQ